MNAKNVTICEFVYTQNRHWIDRRTDSGVNLKSKSGGSAPTNGRVAASS